MIVKEVKKLYRGCISVRDGWVRQAIKKGGLKIKHNDEFMFFDPAYLKTLTFTQTVESKFGNSSYKLADIEWRPIDKNQRNLF